MSVTDYKVVVMGGGGVGKSALTIQLLQNRFEVEYDPTIEASYRKAVTIDEVPCMLDILDTAGQEEFTALRDQYLRSGRGFLLVYAIDSLTSFKEIEELWDQMLRVREGLRTFAVIVANKCDLEGERMVSSQQGRDFAARIGCPFFEASAKSRINVEESFYQLIREIRGNKLEEVSTNYLTKKKLICQII